MQQQPLARREPTVFEQIGVGSEDGFRQRRRVHQIHAGGDRQDVTRIDGGVLRVTAATQQCAHAVADLPATGRLDDFAGDFQPQCFRRARRRRIVPGALQQIGAIDAGSMHADQHLPRRRTRARLLGGVQRVGVALAVADGDGGHRGIAHESAPWKVRPV